MSEDPGPCPHCGGKSDGNVMYSCPPQARCETCGKLWEFGEGIKVLTEEEARRVRPGFFPPKSD